MNDIPDRWFMVSTDRQPQRPSCEKMPSATSRLQLSRAIKIVSTALAGVALLVNTLPIQAAPWVERFAFANPAFQSVWSRSDSAVVDGSVARSYTWGPQPWFDYMEFYRQSPNGLRQVQYFDKARMEINDPTNAGPNGVTNGLLTVELVSGRVKGGDSPGPEDNVQREPATIPVAGDPVSGGNTSAPTYASFRGVATVDTAYRDQDRTGQRIGDVLDKAGNRTVNATLGNDAATEVVAYNTVTGHNVPRVFRDFLQNGPVEAIFAFGYPITDPYWIKARVGGVEKDIFVQLYERRAITYTPSNPAAYRVEMGNVGQHYFQWRYPHLGQPWLPGTGQDVPIAFASERATPDVWQVFTMDTNGNAVTQITREQQETVPYSWRRAYIEGATPRLMTDSKRVRGERQLFSINQRDSNDVRQHTYDDYGGTIAYNGAISPDGTQIAAAVQCCGGIAVSIALLPFTNQPLNVYPSAPSQSDCRYESPSWLPDGSGLVFASNCDGKFAIYRGDIRYRAPAADFNFAAEIVNIRPITNAPTVDNYFPRVSPDGKRVVFASDRSGGGDIYVINIDGTNEQRLTSDPANDGAASWSPDGSAIVFDSNRDGDYEIYRLTLGSGAITQLTANNVDDRWPLWYQ